MFWQGSKELWLLVFPKLQVDISGLCCRYIYARACPDLFRVLGEVFAVALLSYRRAMKTCCLTVTHASSILSVTSVSLRSQVKKSIKEVVTLDPLVAWFAFLELFPPVKTVLNVR